MRKKIVAGNWKMNKTYQEAKALLHDLNKLSSEFPSDVEVIIAPPALYLSEFSHLAQSKIQLSAQNCSEYSSGAYTGEISAIMLGSAQINYCILGHSERRSYFGETNEIVGKKVVAALNNKITPIFCCGEQLEDRENGKHFEVIEKQLAEGVFHLSDEDFKKLIIAYEPVWAIGTGKTASSEQAQEMHAYIRQLIEKNYGGEIANKCTILYGGSCKPSNAVELFSNPDVDGGLIGGAALNAEDFLAIIQANK